MEIKGMKKRILAFVLAVATAVTSWSVDWNALSVEAAESVSELSSTDMIASGDYLGQVYTNYSGGFVKVTSATVAAYLPDTDDAVTYSFSAYTGLTDESDPTSGTQVLTATSGTIYGSAETTKVTASVSLSGIVLAPGESAGVVCSLLSYSGEGDVRFYYSPSYSDGYTSGNGTSWTGLGGDTMALTVASANSSELPSTLLTIVVDGLSGVTDIGMALGESIQLSATQNPAYGREVTFSDEIGKSVVEVTSSGVVTAAEAGDEKVTASTGLSQDTDASINIHVIDARLTTDTFTYTGKVIEPKDYIEITAASALTLGTDYKLTYSTDHTNVGTASVTVTGLGNYIGFEKTLEYTIEPKSLSDMSSAFSAGSHEVDTSTSEVLTSTGVDFNGSSLLYGTDYTATAKIKQRNVDTNGNILSYIYTVTFTGQGNFTDTVSVEVPIRVSAGLQLSDFYSVELADDELEYDGTTQTPTLIFYDRNGNVISQPSHIELKYAAADGSGDPIGPGEATVTITSTIYSGSIVKEYKIVQNIHTYKDIFTITLQPSSIDTNGIYWPYAAGTAITPGVTVRKNTTTYLVAGTDYDVSYTNNVGSSTDATTATITITGKNYYTGKITKTFKIVPDISTAVVYFGNTSKSIDKTKPASSANNYRSSFAMTYEGVGKSLQPAFEVRIGGQKLTADSDYNYAYGKNENAGYGEVTITTMGDEYGVQQITAYFVIAPQELSSGGREIAINTGTTDAQKADYEAFTTYRGTTIELPLYDATDPGYGYSISGLTLGSDYTIGFSNNVNAGTAVITATGTGNYTGTISSSFTIGKRSLADTDTATITIDIADTAYTGLAVTPVPTITVTPNVANNTTVYTLVKDRDFTTSYKNNIAVANKTDTKAPTATITGIGNYTGTVDAKFTITPKSLLSTSMSYTFAGEYVGSGNRTGATTTDDSITFASSFTRAYTGDKRKSYVSIKDGDTTLTSKDYTLSYKDNENVGTATAIITGKGNYADTGTVYITFTISQVDLNSSGRISIEQADASSHPTFTIKDSQLSPSVRSGGVLKSYADDSNDYDYVVTYDTSTGAGEKTAKITGHGNYTGTVEKTYTVGTNLADGAMTITDPTSTLSAGGDGTSEAEAKRIYYLGKNRPNIAIKDKDGNDLTLTTDYTLSYEAVSGDGYSANSVVCVTATAASTSEQVFGEIKGYYYIEPAVLSTATVYNYILNVEGNTVDYNGGYTYAYSYVDGTITPNIGLSYYPYEAGYYDAHDGSHHAFDALTVMTAGTDFEINPTSLSGSESSAGTIFTITAEGNYKGTAYITFTVGKRDFTKVTITPSTIADQYYTGSEIKPEITVMDGDTLLTEGVEYTINYSNNIEVSTEDSPAEISVTAKTDSHYLGTQTLKFNIVKETLNSTNTTVTVGAKKEYTGSAVTLDASEITVNYMGKVLTYGTDYELEYSNNVGPGEATVSVKGTGLYSSSATAPPTGTFPIYLNLENESLYKVTGLDSQNEYTFSLANTRWTKRNESGTLTNEGIGILINGVDTGFKLNTNFTVTKNQMTIPGETGNITITGTGENQFCSGSVVYDTKVYGDITEATFSVEDGAYYFYTGENIRPSVTVRYNGTTISSNSYSVEYRQGGSTEGDFKSVLDTDDQNKRTMTVEGDANHYFTGTKSFSYYIYYNITDATVTGIKSSYSYTDATKGGVIPIVTAGSGSSAIPLVAGVDYEIKHSSSIPTDSDKNSAGATITVTINGINKRSIGRQVLYYTVNGAVLNSSTVDWVSDELGTRTEAAQYAEVYNGKVHEPSFGTVKYNDSIVLVEGTDYTVSYRNNINAGTLTATAILKGIGNYSGTMEKSFSIMKKNIATYASDISPSIDAVKYTGVKVYPTSATLYDTVTKKTLTLNTDFKFANSDVTNNINASTSPAHVTFTVNENNQNYTGSNTFDFEIKPLDLSDASVVIEQNSAVYTGSAITPTLEVLVDGNKLSSSVYKVSYNNSAEMVDVGTYDIVVSPANNDGNIIGTVPETFEVTAKPLSDSEVESYETDKYTITYTYKADGKTTTTATDIKDGDVIFKYDGKAKTFDSIRIKDKARTAARGTDVYLVEGTDYKISYSENDGSSTDKATLTITGIGNYSDDIVKTFKIGTDISDDLSVILDKVEYVYDGKEHKPVPTVYSGSTKLTEGTDYTLSYYNSADTTDDTCIAVGTWVVKVESAGNGYYGSATKEYKIVRKSADKDKILIKVTDPTFKQDSEGIYYTTYTGSEIEPTIEVYDTEISSKTPLDESEYSVTYTNNVNAGNNTATIVVKLGDNYTTTSGTITQAFTIKPLELGKDTTIRVVYSDETGSEDDRYYAYTGSEITPTVVITHKVGDDVITLDPADYTLYMTDDGTADGTAKNIAPGEAPVTAVGKRNFTGTTYGTSSTTFDIAADLSTAFDISEDNMVDINTQFYSGSPINPAVTAVIEGVTLKQNDDFTTTPYDPSTYTTTDGVPSKGKVDLVGNTKYYVGTYTAEFEISTDIDRLLTIEGLDDETYTGKAIKPEYGDDFVIVDPNGMAISASNIGTITYTSDDDNECIKVGKVELSIPVEVDGDTHTLVGEFNIVPALIKDVNISYMSSVTYTGAAKTANLRLTYKGKTLKEGTDYEVSYNNNIYPSEIVVNGSNQPASFTITGKGNFDDSSDNSVTRTFMIEVQAMRNVSATSSGTDAITLSWDKKNYVSGYKIDVLNRSNNLVKSYTINNRNTTSYTITGLTGGDSYSVHICGYVDANNNRYLGPITSITGYTDLPTPTISAASSGSNTATVSLGTIVGDGAYEIFRSASSATGYEPIVKLRNGATTYTDSGLTSGQTYYYIARLVKVINDTIIYSDLSNPVAVTAR